MSDDQDSDYDGTAENDAERVANQIFDDDDDETTMAQDERSQSSQKGPNEAENQYGELDESYESGMLSDAKTWNGHSGQPVLY